MQSEYGAHSDEATGDGVRVTLRDCVGVPLLGDGVHVAVPEGEGDGMRIARMRLFLRSVCQ